MFTTSSTSSARSTKLMLWCRQPPSLRWWVAAAFVYCVITMTFIHPQLYREILSQSILLQQPVVHTVTSSTQYVPTDSNHAWWNRVEFVSGIFGHNTTLERDTWIENQCTYTSIHITNLHGRAKDRSSGKYNDRCSQSTFRMKDSDETTDYATNFKSSCCYCYNGYPTFLDHKNDYNQERWTKYRHQFGSDNTATLYPPGNTTGNNNERRYWFCIAEPYGPDIQHHINVRRQSIANTAVSVDHHPTTKNNVILLTGKWGHNDTFKETVLQLCDDLKATGFIHPDNIFCYYNETIFEESVGEEQELYQRFQKDHLQYRYDPDHPSKRGAGFWFHKCVLIYHHMLLLLAHNNDNDAYILYIDVDVGVFLQNDNFYTILDQMHYRNADLALQVMDQWYEMEWTKEDMITAFEDGDQFRTTSQINAGILFIRNSPAMRHFFRYAYIECMTDYHMVSDAVSILPNNDTVFIENRHDQSVLGLLVKQYFTKHPIMIEPPMMTYLYYDKFYTYQIRQHDIVDITCPFERHWEQLLRTTKKRATQTESNQIKNGNNGNTS